MSPAPTHPFYVQINKRLVGYFEGIDSERGIAWRRAYLRHHDNILKRLLIHIAGFNLSLIMRKLFSIGTARRQQDLAGPPLRS